MSLQLLVLTDSVSLPREHPEHTYYKNSWPELLRKEGHNVIQCSIGGATITDLVKQCFYYNEKCFEIDVVLVQCGIVDCAPRFLKRSELKLLQSLPVVGKKLITALNKNWVRKLRKITYTPSKKYIEGVKAIQTAFKNSNVLFLEIAPAHQNYEKALTGITKNIHLYNALLAANSSTIKLDGVEKEGMMSDYHHFNEAGHRFVFNQIKKALN